MDLNLLCVSYTCTKSNTTAAVIYRLIDTIAGIAKRFQVEIDLGNIFLKWSTLAENVYQSFNDAITIIGEFKSSMATNI